MIDIPKPHSINPKTHSDILWHFTGGPNWSEMQQKQLKQKKTLPDSYKSFCSILQERKYGGAEIQPGPGSRGNLAGVLPGRGNQHPGSRWRHARHGAAAGWRV